MTCQYCNKRKRRVIIEHVVPACHKGPNELHNLVVSCQQCNGIKGPTVWIPRNLDAITAESPEWKKRILASASPLQKERIHWRKGATNKKMNKYVALR